MNTEFNNLIDQLKKCRFCEEKFGFEPHPVIIGNQNSKIVQISQAPSATVHQTLMSFSDLSGKRLKYEWYQTTDAEFYNPDNFYITALAHCYPGKNKNGNDNNPPKVCYEKWVKNEVKYINNKIYVIIGSKAVNIFFHNENFNELVFKNNTLNGKLAIVLPHPSPLNIRWFKDNPEFFDKRILEVRKIIKDVLNENYDIVKDLKIQSF